MTSRYTEFLEAKREFITKGMNLVADCPVVVKIAPDEKSFSQRIAELHERTAALLRPVRS